MSGEGKDVLYLKDGCPFCMKVLIFLGEVGELKNFVLEKDTEDVRAALEQAMGKKPTFPTMLLDGAYIPDSDEIVKTVSEKKGVSVEECIAFSIYTNSILKGYINMVRFIGHEDAAKVIKGEKTRE